ncbi:MAG: M15 family metallopeptidase [Bacteroidales bacterium]|nr:M15 family metallopeptidase [Candidatus Colicola faecequi]
MKRNAAYRLIGLGALALSLVLPSCRPAPAAEAAEAAPSVLDEEMAVLLRWDVGAVVSDSAVALFSLDSCFRSSPLPDAVFARMEGRSYQEGCPVGRDELRYLRMLHRNDSLRPQLGEMVANRIIADELLEAFRTMYEGGYPIHRMVLIDDYGADDGLSMAANNTSCFCYRRAGHQRNLSRHSWGMAVDINPLQNPYITRFGVEPGEGADYAYRRDSLAAVCPQLITTESLPYRMLHDRFGFQWGGRWMHSRDYQHFQK